MEDGLRDAIRCGRLAAGERLPSSRALAADLGITRGVVVDAYDQLAAEGYLTTVQGSGTRVNDVNGRRPRAGVATAGTGAPVEARPGPSERPPPPPSPAPPLAYDFRSGLPDLGLFPRAAWARATRAALASMPDAELGYLPPAGLPGVRASVAAYLGRVRGVACTPDQVVMCNGFGHGFTLVLRALARRGVTGVAVEVPGYDEPRVQIADAGATAYPVPVDGEGISTEALAALPPGAVGAVVVTPAHQSPTGVVLSPARRTELVDWARGAGAYVIEDDYDAEYRYDRQPVGALQGVAPDRVVYQGTPVEEPGPGAAPGVAGRPARPHRRRPAGPLRVRPHGHVDRAGHLRRVPRAGRPRPAPPQHPAGLPRAPRRAAGRPRPLDAGAPGGRGVGGAGGVRDAAAGLG